MGNRRQARKIMARTRKKAKTKAGRRRTVFLLEAPEAGLVSLVGSFNDWDEKSHRMNKNDDGIWEKILMLYPGRYEYKFLVDGQWWNDPGNDRVCVNSFGTLNSVVEVSGR
jgi:1,4-alpha-glucan branching enzyme